MAQAGGDRRRAVSARAAWRRHRRHALHRRRNGDHRRHPRHPARPAGRPPRLWPARADVARDARPHRPHSAGKPDPLDLPAEAARAARQRQDGAQHHALHHRGQVPRKRLCHQRLDRSGAVHPARGEALHPVHQPRRIDRAAPWRHRRRQRHRQLHGEEARRHRHLQDARRLEQARACRLSDPGAHARRHRHRHRPSSWRADPCASLRHLWRGAAHRARGRAASPVASDRGRRRSPHHAALRASAAWAAPKSCRPPC